MEKDHQTAIEKFLKREFPEIVKNQPHDPIFIPDTYLYGNMTEKVSWCFKI